MQLKALLHDMQLKALTAFVAPLLQFAFQFKLFLTTKPGSQQKFVTEEKQSKIEGVIKWSATFKT